MIGSKPNKDDFPLNLNPRATLRSVTPVRQPAAGRTAAVHQGLLISVAFGAALLAIALAQAIVYRQWINGDSISYMDMGDAIPTGNIGRLINPYWSPLYSALLGLVNAVCKPGPEWEFPAAHLVNFVCFLFAGWAFGYLLRSMWRILAFSGSSSDGSLPRWAFLIIGYSLFLYASLGMVALMRTTPDMLLSGCLYLAAACLIRIRTGEPSIRDFVFLGIALAFGYMAKAIMFPLSLFVLALTLFFGGPARLRIRRTTAAALAFAILSAPLVAAVSRSAHRLTFSETGTVLYMFFIDRLDLYFQNQTEVVGHAIHPVAKISQDPPVYSFASPHNATYSLWFNPYYWGEGLRPTLRIRTQIGIVLERLREYAHTLLQLAGMALAILILGVLVGPRRAIRSMQPFWPILAMGLTLLAAYLFAPPKIEDRYIGAPIAIVAIALLYGLLRVARLSRIALLSLVALVALNLCAQTAINMRRDFLDNALKAQRSEVDAALALQRLGFTPGTRVAAISPWISPGWARLSRLIIVADVPREQAEHFWDLPRERQASALSAFASTGSQAVVAWIGGRKDVPEGWQRLASTPYALYLPR